MSTLVFGFGSFYLLVRHLPKSEFGAWALFLTVTTILEASRNGLVQNAFIKLLFSTHDSERNKIITSAWLINGAYSVILFLTILPLSAFLGSRLETPDLLPMFKYYGITLFLLIPFSQFNYTQQANFSFSGIFWSTIVRQGSFFVAVLVLAVYRFHVSLPSLVLIQAVCTLLGLVTAFFCARRYLTFQFIYDHKAAMRVFNFGKYVMGTNILSMLYKGTDQLLLGLLVNASSVAAYNSAIRLSNLIEYPTTSIAEVTYPRGAAQFEEKKEVASKVIFEKALALTVLITLPMVVFTLLFSDWLILVIAGPAYAESAEILRVTALFGLFTPFSRQFGTAMDSSGRPMTNFWVLFVSLVVNLATNFLLIREFGLIGAAYGTLISYAISTMICYILMVRVFKIEMQNVFRYMGTFARQGVSFFGKKIALH